MFQFLIGLIKTKRSGKIKINIMMFQFLIGLIKTNGRVYSGKSFMGKFQFLIGLIKTFSV